MVVRLIIKFIMSFISDAVATVKRDKKIKKVKKFAEEVNDERIKVEKDVDDFMSKYERYRRGREE